MFSEHLDCEVHQSDLVSGNRYLMVDTNHAVVVTAVKRPRGMAVLIEKSFLVGFFAIFPMELQIDTALGNVKFFEVEENA
jgi:hypothetical protein